MTDDNSYLFKIVDGNHDLQVRYKWSTNDTAVWSHTSSFHTGSSFFSLFLSTVFAFVSSPPFLPTPH
jgi:hypothetical protein